MMSSQVTTPGVGVPQQLQAPLHEVQPLLAGTPAGGLGGVVGEVDDGAEEEQDGRDTENHQVGVDLLCQLLSILAGQVLTVLNLESITPDQRFTVRHFTEGLL